MCYISKILSEIGEYNNIQSNCTCSKANFSKDDIIKNNENYYQKCDLRLTDKDRSLPIMNWLPKRHKHQLELHLLLIVIFIKDCSTKPLPGVISKKFKMLFKQVEKHNLFKLQKILGTGEFFSNY